MRNKVAKHLRKMSGYSTTKNEKTKMVYKMMKEAHKNMSWHERYSGE